MPTKANDYSCREQLKPCGRTSDQRKRLSGEKTTSSCNSTQSTVAARAAAELERGRGPSGLMEEIGKQLWPSDGSC